MKTIPERFSKRQWDYLSKVEDSWFNVAEGGKRAGKNVVNVFAFCTLLETHPDSLFLIAGVTQGTARLNILECDGLGVYNYFNGRYKKSKYENKDAIIVQTKVGTKVIIVAGGGKKGDEAIIKGNSFGMVYLTEANELTTEFINECFDRTIASKNRKIFHDLNPKSPKHPYYTDILSFHEEKQRNNPSYGYNYGHFTLVDNYALSDEKIKEVLNTYNRNSVWYKRDVRGERIQAEGLVYEVIANNIDEMNVDEEYIKKIGINKIVIGVDFGGNGSFHSFVATGFNLSKKEIIVLASKRINAKGTSPVDLEREYILFTNYITDKWGMAVSVRCDSAEQVLIQGIINASHKNNCKAVIYNAIKGNIIDRIRFTTKMAVLGRLHFLKNTTKSLQSALCNAVWDSKSLDDVRLDDGTTDIDSLDSFEYSFESEMKYLNM